MSTPFTLERGARALAEGGVRFAVWAPRARRVAVRLEGEKQERAQQGAKTLERELTPCGDGVFEGVLAEAAPGADYRYRLDHRLDRPDPVSRHQPRGVHGPSRVVEPGGFAWSDAGWKGIPPAELVIYELHVGTFTEAGRFEAVAERLAGLRELGVTALEIMPVAEFPGGRNWGYDGVFPYAPQSSYGGPEGLRRLVDAAHAAGLAVLLDVVYNHLGPEGNYLGDFGPYFTDRYRTPWGQAVNVDGADSDEVRRYFVDNALHWIAEYHLDGLRLDAVHAIHDESPRPFLAELAGAVHTLGAELGRRVHVIAESDANDPRLVRPVERGGLGLDAVWSDDFHHALHVALTAETHGYYADYADPTSPSSIAPVAKVFSDRFVYDGQRSAFRRRRHGAPAGDVPGERFVVCVQNHDQIGNRARGDRLSTLLSPPRLRLAAAALLLSPYVPLLFMGEEYGETAPFQYFVSHGDPQLVEAVREGRRREFAAFHAGGEVPDPAAPETFAASRLRPERAAAPGHRELRALYAALLRLRREQPALRPGRAAVEVQSDLAAGWLRVDYAPSGATPAFAVFHFGNEPASLPAPAGRWRLRLDTEDAAFGGKGSPAPERLEGAGAQVRVAPETALFYASEAS